MSEFFGYDSEDTVKRLKIYADRMSAQLLLEFVNECIAFTLKHGTDWEEAGKLPEYESLFKRMKDCGFENSGDGSHIVTFRRILNAYPNETVTILSDLIDRNMHKVVAPIEGLSESLQCLPGAMIIQSSGNCFNHYVELWDKWYSGWILQTTGKSVDKDSIDNDIWYKLNNVKLDDSLAKAFWNKHIDTKDCVKNTYTQVTGLPAPTA